MSDNGKLLVQANLSGEQLADFEQIKAHHGITSNAEVVRLLIRKEARRVAQLVPAIYDIIVAYHAGRITAEEAVSAIGGHGDTLS